MAGVKCWVGFDLDGTLAKYEGWNDGEIGEPVEPMVKRARQLLAEGTEIRIVTARVSGKGQFQREVADQMRRIQAWCREHLGTIVPITNEKDFAMTCLYDDRAKQVIPNTGVVLEDLMSMTGYLLGATPDTPTAQEETAPET